MLPRLRQRVLPTAVRERCRLARTGHLRMSERTPREYCEVPNDAQPTAGGAAGTALYSQHQPVTQSSAVLVVLLSAVPHDNRARCAVLWRTWLWNPADYEQGEPYKLCCALCAAGPHGRTYSHE